MLTGERIQLRAFRPDEFETVRAWFDDPAKVSGPQQPYWPGIGDEVVQSLQYDNNPNEREGRFAIEVLDSQTVIGMIRYYTVSLLSQSVEFFEIGYMIADLGERRKGYAREACIVLINHLFDSYDIRRVGASTLGANEPSARLLEGLGFTHEGSTRQAVMIGDQWADLFWYGLLREEWTGRR